MSASEKRQRGDELGRGFVDAAFGFGPGERGAGEAASRSSSTAKTPSKQCEDREDLRRRFGAEGACVGGGVGGADAGRRWRRGLRRC